jgi:tetratricopeptide (TPR) repeat protein
MLYEVITMYLQMQDMPQASSYAQRLLVVMQTAKKPEGIAQDQWDLKISQLRAFAHGAIGEAAYAKNDVPTAMKNLEAAVKANKKYDFAYYRLGFLYWKAGRVDEACMAFAKAFVLEGRSAQDAKNQLYTLYQSTKGNTRGVPAIIQQAREILK